jgi:hypothetical protein
MNRFLYFFLALGLIAWTSCEDEAPPALDLPAAYTSADFDNNVTAENTLIDELSAMTSAVNAAEANAQSTPVAVIEYPTTLAAVTLPSYRPLIEGWLVELVKAANSPDGFQNPSSGTPADGQEGGLLGSRLLDENGLELEQMVQKGAFGAALYNHALTVINSGPTSDDIDKLVEIHGADIAFDPGNTTAAATYSRRRSDLVAETGFFYDIRNNLITAKAALEQGDAFKEELNQALADYLLNWEKSNFATVIYYANATKVQLQNAFTLPDGPDRDAALGNALHAYAEGVAFTHGFRGIGQKQITDAEIDSILDLLLAPAAQAPTSYRFLNEATLLANLDQIIDEIQGIYGFTNEEVTSFFINNNP